MNELNLDAESITRNKTYDAKDHLHHLLKVGWLSDSPLIKKFLIENHLTNSDLLNAIAHLNESNSKECCTERDKH
ncbi:MAG: hypothetical protein HY094_08025 [Candidatus Melainabacteria bacterium]|nr:hypothetical protein [Candidatus Melainabacteria bacterium]